MDIVCACPAPTYADAIVSDALDDADYQITPKGYAPTTSATLTDTQRSQIIGKGVAYINAWIYSLHELYSALGKCESGSYAYSAPHAWDEGWAFYAGSAQAVGSTSTSDLAYELAEKRCTDFGTCGAAGTSSDSADRPSLVNRNLLYLYNLGLAQIQANQCDQATTTKNYIVQQMTIPLVQGTLKYVYKSDPAGGASGTASSDEKAMAEGWAFSAALLPLLNACDESAAKKLYDNINMGLGTSGAVPDGYVAVKAKIEAQYSCLGITCADVGAYGSYWTACDDSSSPTVFSGSTTMPPTPAPVEVVSESGASRGASRGALSTAIVAFAAIAFATILFSPPGFRL